MSLGRGDRLQARALTPDAIRGFCDPAVFRRGQDYARSGRVVEAWTQGDLIGGRCQGSEPAPYHVVVHLASGRPGEARCDCPYDFDDYCKHVIAVLLTYAAAPGSFAERPDPVQELLQRPPAEIEATLEALAREWSPFEDWLAARLHIAPSTSSASSDAIEVAAFKRSVESAIHSLDRMRGSEAYWQVGSVANELRALMMSASARIHRGEVRNGLELLLVLAEAAAEAFDVLDDSDGEVGDFVTELAEELAAALAVVDLPAGERRAIAQRLEFPSREVADYGIDDGFDDAILAALAGVPGAEEGLEAEARERLVGVRLHGLERAGKEDEYLDLCLQAGRRQDHAEALIRFGRLTEALPTAMSVAESPEIALALARAFAEAGDRHAALAIGRRGLDLTGSNTQLAAWLAPLADDLGDFDSALLAYRLACNEAPTLARYASVRRLSGEAWRIERPPLLAAARRERAIDILLYEELWDDAIAAVEARGPYDYVFIEEVVQAVGAERPDWAIAACQRQIDALVSRADSKRYPPVARWLEHTRRVHLAVDRAREWNTYLRTFREQYRRRPALMAAIARIKEA